MLNGSDFGDKERWTMLKYSQLGLICPNPLAILVMHQECNHRKTWEERCRSCSSMYCICVQAAPRNFNRYIFRDTYKTQKAHGPWQSAWEPTWPLAKVPKVPHTLSFNQRGAILSLFSLYGPRFLRYRPIFKITILGHETWPLANVLEVAHILSFYPYGVEIELIFTLQVVVSEIQTDFQNWYIWAWNLAIDKNSRSCTYTFFLSQEVEIELIFALQIVVSI